MSNREKKKYIFCQLCQMDGVGVYHLAERYCPIHKQNICDACCAWEKNIMSDKAIACKEVNCEFAKDI